MNENEKNSLIALLDKAETLASQYTGGYSGGFFSAEEFHEALSESIRKLKNGDNSQLDKLHLWFLPTSCLDDFVGKEGEHLGNEISRLLSMLVN
jgi:hypothetical protein